VNIYEKCRHAKSGTKSGTKMVVRFFLCPISAFSTRCPLGKEKKRTFTKSGGLLLDSFFTAFVPLFCRNISYIISVRVYPNLSVRLKKVHGFISFSH
jgi:hypothetical protein